MDQVFKQAEEIVRETGKWIDSIRKERGSGEIHQKGDNDFVTQTDLEAENKLVVGLKSLITDAGFLTEEGSVASSEDVPYRWIIDPIDGTTNFIYGLPCFSVSVGLESKTADGWQMEWGMVYEVSREESFTAARGQGAFLNGKQIYVRESTGIKGSLMATGFPYKRYAWMNEWMEVLRGVLNECRGLRRWGSAAVDLAYVASGRYNGYFEYNINPWDVAGGVILVQEAGGMVVPFAGSGNAVHDRSLISGSPALVNEVLQIISREFPESQKRGA